MTTHAAPASTTSHPHALDFARAWDYSPAPETAKITIAPRYGLFINGQFTNPPNTFETINPATEETLSEVSLASAKDVDRAVAAARAAFPKWAALPGVERAKYLFRIARRIQERSRELAILETMDGGKPIKESRDVDLPLVAQHFFYYAGWADKLRYAFPSSSFAPVGVCAQIIPWNFPLMMAAWKIAPALACGNTVILKPAETTPLTALRLAEIFQEIGLPPGVVNIVTGDGSTGAALANHKDIDKIAFTGSTDVGKRLAKVAAQRAIPITLELGGKSANIIFDDAPIDQAVEGIVSAIYFNQGHVCCAGSRLLVQEGVVDEVIAKLRIRLQSLRVGDPLDKNTDVGAINSKMQFDKINEYLKIGADEGATLEQPNACTLPKKGFFCRPTFFTGVQQSHRIAREEIFGPVLAVMTFRTPDEAISKGNNTPYGLSAGVWTSKGSKIFETAGKLKAGVVWCNTFNQFDASSPFGGYKESGFGREGGLHGLRPYVRL
ncbi:MAG: aldehyde dehydrogenase family protein [Phycisphaerae bacterium]|nr:aldehyde dehydrogenase family protein [Phycisphaerae bacterium]